MKLKITCISDTHTKHDDITEDLPGGDLLLYAGDLMNSGRNAEDIKWFCEWFDGLDGYKTKVFIAGNHDRMFENDHRGAMEIVNSFKNITYLQDSWLEVGDDNNKIKIYGSPWQPWFYDWAFNLQRNSIGLAAKWEAIPEDTDIVITHGPAYGFVDTVVGRRHNNLGCELLAERLQLIKPKIHLCGHIHSGYGIMSTEDTHFINASVLNEQYNYTQPPLTFDWDSETNEITFI
jgi:Icc-related predicted phosphoesterase